MSDVMEEKELIKKVIKKFGKNNQIIQFYEELNELGGAVNHYRREKVDKQFLVNEIADVLFMIEQIKYMYYIEHKEVDEAYDYTKERLIKKLEDGDYK